VQWSVGVQAKEGGIPRNQDSGLESEADAMGKLAAQGKKTGMSSQGKNESGPVQMKKHPMKLGGGDEWYGKDDSYWDVNTALRITPNGKGTMEFNLEDGDVFQASAQIAQQMDGVNGEAEIVSNTTTMVDNILTNEEQEAESVSQFEYQADTSNKISLAPISGMNEKIPIIGPYSMHRSLEGSNSGRIKHQLQFKEVPWDVTESKSTSEAETSNSGGDFSTGASQQTKVNLQVKLNEEDILVLLGGKPVFKGSMAEAKESGALLEAVGGELESKDRVNLSVDNDTAQRIAGDFNHAWTDASTSSETETRSRSYQDMGGSAAEHHSVVIDQALEQLGNVKFEQEDQAELSDESKNLIRAFLKNNQAMLDQVRIKGSGYYIGLAGFATSTGSKGHNQQLAGVRAMQVRSFMIMENPALLPRHFDDISSFGESGANPYYTDPVDRRVEIVIGRKGSSK
jgi:outer membrane protein OmpA-like peptidoglycan-associated protein